MRLPERAARRGRTGCRSPCSAPAWAFELGRAGTARRPRASRGRARRPAAARAARARCVRKPFGSAMRRLHDRARRPSVPRASASARRLEHAAVVAWHHLHELARRLGPVGRGGAGATGEPVSSTWRPTISSRRHADVLVVERLEVDHLGVEPPGEHRLGVVARRRRRRTCRRAKLRPVGPRTTTRPPVMYSQPWSPTPSTTAVAPELRTQNRSPTGPRRKSSPLGRAVER